MKTKHHPLRTILLSLLILLLLVLVVLSAFTLPACRRFRALSK